METLDLIQEWNAKRGLLKTLVEERLTYDYAACENEISRESVADALALMKFVAEEINVNSRVGVRQRLEFLKGFMEESWHTRIVAMAESLPTKVWRKLLWKYNIDLVSVESFLRRISHSQYLELEKAYKEFVFMRVVPSVMQSSFFGLIRRKRSFEVCFGNLTCADFVDRYDSKGAWVSNLAGLDFGFNRYPNGEGDDEQSWKSGFENFVSVKNHIDDFVVNQEDGIYWAMYRTARSNIAWFPDRKVELSAYVCPGFWVTLMIHFFFWVVSPVCFLLFIFRHYFDFSVSGVSSGWFYVYAFGRVTVFWLILAGTLKFLEFVIWVCVGEFADGYFTEERVLSRLVSKGYSIESAEAIMRNRERVWTERYEWFSRSSQRTGDLIVMVVRFVFKWSGVSFVIGRVFVAVDVAWFYVSRFAGWVRMVVRDLFNLRKVFREHCPRVMETKKLNI